MYTVVPPKSCRKALQPVIDKFRKPYFIIHPLMAQEDTNHIILEDNKYKNGVTEGRFDDKEYKIWQAAMHLMDSYLEYGWDVNAVEQTSFRRDEVLDKRRRHPLDVVQSPKDSDAGACFPR